MSLWLLGLCYLTTSPDQDQAVSMIRLMTVTSILDTGARSLLAPSHDQYTVDIVTGLCNIVRSVLVFSMASGIVNTFIRYENP